MPDMGWAEHERRIDTDEMGRCFSASARACHGQAEALECDSRSLACPECPWKAPITIMDLARQLGVRTEAHVAVTAADLDRVGLAIAGGCSQCGASLGAWNAYPARDGAWRCRACIADSGWTNAADAARDILAAAAEEDTQP